MRKVQAIFVTALGLLLMGTTLSAKDFTDVTPKHWAYDFVNKAVESGILAGFPDGTFRGNKTISRFEVAKIVSNLLEQMGGSGGTTLEDLQVDLKALKTELQAFKRSAPGGSASGTFTARGRLSNLVSKGGSNAPRSDFRLETGFQQTITKDAALRIHLDTMDAGYNNAAATDLFQNLLDLTATFNADLGWENPIAVAATFGPGPVLHTEPAGLTLDAEKYYQRPRTGLSLTTHLAGVVMTGNYFVQAGSSVTGIATAHRYQLLGKIDVSNWIRREGTTITASTNLFSRRSGVVANDLNGSVIVHVLLLPKLSVDGEVGMTSLTGSGLHLGADLQADNVLGTATTLGLQIHRIGSQFVSLGDIETDLAGYDYFGRVRRNATWDIGLRFTQKLPDNWGARLLWNLKTDSSFGSTGANAMNALEIALNRQIAPQTMLEASYQQFGRSTLANRTDLLSGSVQFQF